MGDAKFNTATVGDGATGSIQAIFDSFGLQPADYFVKASITADDVPLEGNTTFKIGMLDVAVKDYTKELSVGGIKRFVLSVGSNWNDPVPVFADINIYDKNVSVKTRTATFDLKPWGEADLEAYIDTSSLQPKMYDLHVDLRFGEKQKSFDDKILLVAANTSVEEVVKEQPGSMTLVLLTAVLLIVVVLLTLINVFMVLKNNKKK